ncbi:MAG: hypothetical protein ACOCTR_02570 [Candidatus Natronoplasma sp.]
MSIERALISASLFLPPVIAGFLSLHSVYWFLPFVFGFAAVVGYNMKNFFILDVGVFLSLASYLFVNRGMNPSAPLNLLVVIGILFMHITLWLYVKNVLFISGIEKISAEGARKNVAAFKRSALNEIVSCVLLGALLAFAGSFIGMNSYLGLEVGGRGKILLMMVLSTSVFFVIYGIVKLLSAESPGE